MIEGYWAEILEMFLKKNNRQEEITLCIVFLMRFREYLTLHIIITQKGMLWNNIFLCKNWQWVGQYSINNDIK